MSNSTALMPFNAPDADIVRSADAFRIDQMRRGFEPPAIVHVPLRAPALFKSDVSDTITATVTFYGDGPRVERRAPETIPA